MSLDINEIKEQIEHESTSLGIELGLTRIKAVLIGEDRISIASDNHDQGSGYVDHIWAYTLGDIWSGIRDCYGRMAEGMKKTYGITLTTIGSIGSSAMMHGHMASNKEGELLIPFRIWGNAITGPTVGKLTEVFRCNIPQRWSIARLYQAVLNKGEHVKGIDYLIASGEYMHWKLTDRCVLGIGDVMGMLPMGIHARDFGQKRAERFDQLATGEDFPWKLRDILPKALVAGEDAGVLTGKDVRLLGTSESSKADIPTCPLGGDAGTGVTATNSVAVRIGNASANTSVFAMVMLEKEPEYVYPKIDLVTTPAGDMVAIVHCNNCTSDLGAWANLFKEFSEAMDTKANMNQLFGTLCGKTLEGDSDCGSLLAYNYFSEEHITHFKEGRSLFVCTPDSRFNLVNFMRVHLYTSLGALGTGMDILLKKEYVKVDSILGHGRLSETKGVGQRILVGAMNAPVPVVKIIGEGGAWGIALLASYMRCRREDETLDVYLAHKVFVGNKGIRMEPVKEGMKGFEALTKWYVEGLAAERATVEHMRDWAARLWSIEGLTGTRVYTDYVRRTEAKDI